MPPRTSRGNRFRGLISDDPLAFHPLFFLRRFSMKRCAVVPARAIGVWTQSIQIPIYRSSDVSRTDRAFEFQSLAASEPWFECWWLLTSSGNLYNFNVWENLEIGDRFSCLISSLRASNKRIHCEYTEYTECAIFLRKIRKICRWLLEEWTRLWSKVGLKLY